MVFVTGIGSGALWRQLKGRMLDLAFSGGGSLDPKARSALSDSHLCAVAAMLQTEWKFRVACRKAGLSTGDLIAR